MPETLLEKRTLFMREAISEARKAADAGETPVGAVLVYQDAVIARAHNEVEARRDASAHAELLCIRRASGIRGQRLNGCTLYVTMEPCAMCAGALVNSRISELVFGAFDAAQGCCGSLMDLTDHCLQHTVDVYGGLLEDECAALLTDFFRSVRK